MSQSNHSSLRGYEFTPPPPEVINEQLPGFEVDQILGAGGMGAVYRGWQKSLHRHVAIKVLPTELEAVEGLAERFESEARAMARLSHGNIAGVFDINRTAEGHSYFVMEYVDGGTLFEVMERQGLDTEEIVSLLCQVCEGLQYAHDRGVVHRDVKPNNILINTDGKVKLVDFGLAHVGEGVSVGGAAGTPRYMAPELFEEGSAVDGRADLYSLGVILYEMLTGGPPRGEFKPPSDVAEGVHRDFDRIVTRAMQRRPVNRQQTALELREQLRTAGQEKKSDSPAPMVVGAGSKALNVGPLHNDPAPSHEHSSPPARSTRPPTHVHTHRPQQGMMGIPDWWPMLLIGIFIVAGLIALGIWWIESQG